VRKPNPGDFLWSDAAIARLTKLWLDGVTSGEIGRLMGITRSSAMGKLRRLDLLCRDRPGMPTVRRPARLLLKSSEQVSKRRNKRPLPPPKPYQAPPPPPEPPGIGL